MAWIVISSGCTGGGGGFDWPFGGLRTVTVPPPVDNPPTALIGPDQVVSEGALVTLEGSGYDAEGPVSYEWRQTIGPVVNLSNPTSGGPTFVAPPVAQRTELRFRFRVIDRKGQVGSDGVAYVSVFVEPATQPPEFVLLDFEMLPDGSLPVEFEPVEADYVAECVVFRNLEPTDASKSPEYRRFVPGNTVVWDNDRVFNPPPETTFNVTVDFIVPAASVTADVYVEPGSSVTLRAFDETGAQIGSATSEVSTDCCVLKTGTVDLADLGWIHQATFETSAPNTHPPAIDNLLFERRLACD